MAALSARDGARNAVVLAQLMGLREHGVRLQNLVIDAEYRLVELLPPKSVLTPDQVYQLRKVYGGLPLVGWPLGVTMFEATGQIAGFVTCYKE